jgi:dethiobiotin synthetase
VPTFFVTSSGTGIGKTFVCCRLLAALPVGLRIRAVKPVVTGFPDKVTNSMGADGAASIVSAASTVSDTAMVADSAVATVAASDTGRLIQALGLPLNAGSIEATSPWRFREPLAADMAAARENRQIDFSELLAFSRAPADVDLNLVEGIGGVMAPINAERTVLDWIAAIDARAVLVVGSYLAALSHSLTAFTALGARGIGTTAIVISQSEDEPVPTAETAASLRRFVGATPVLTLPRTAHAGAAEVAALLLKEIGRV